MGFAIPWRYTAVFTERIGALRELHFTKTLNSLLTELA
ncbi:hypothetical protein SynRS9915_01474 [Synechococcus sp. RS9915]|nr:hypothetical protein SynRS9915_01474 [Synechococcus sp. RS9915]